MKIPIYVFLQITMLLWISSCSQSDSGHFQLCSEDETASVYILPGEPEYVHLAAQDLISDVEKITGKKIPLISSIEEGDNNCIIVGSANLIRDDERIKQIVGNDFDGLEGKWEAYRVKNYKRDKNYLVISGSDYRGTMFGIYDFIEQYLGVDPLYFWTDFEPEKKEKLSWPQINIEQEEPTFKYRGWFLNDEDLLTEWMESAGPRFIDYPFYSQVVNPKIMEKVVEAMLRLRYNLIIPASFIDIGNPPEKQLVDIAAARGVFLSMHHIEPMGVNGFTYRNYWKERGEDYKFSFYSNPEAMKEIWRVYAERWAEYPNVVWQIGLRGTADRPMWTDDPNIPKSDEFRGKLISDAMKVQMEIIKSVDAREEIPVTTTLWMEGSNLNKEGYLTFPDDVMVIFSDNSPGWELQPDFFETEREPGRKYGIYYHHQLWGTGPHLAQGVSPSKAYEIFKLAVDYDSHEYAILNVSNIREFPLGIEANAEIMYNFNEFDPDIFFAGWCEQRFGGAAKEAEAAYRQFFNSYQTHGERDMVFLLDGQMRSFGLGLLRNLKARLSEPQKNHKKLIDFNNRWVGNISIEEVAKKIYLQKEGMTKAGELAEQAQAKLNGQSLDFFEVNMIAQQKILLGINTWLDALVNATIAANDEDWKTSVSLLEDSMKGFDLIWEGKELGSRGEKWENWYRGDKKMNLPDVEKSTREVLETAQKSILELPQKLK